MVKSCLSNLNIKHAFCFLSAFPSIRYIIKKKQAFLEDAHYALLMIFQFTQMEAYVLIFCKIAGVRHTTFHQFSPQSRSVTAISYMINLSARHSKWCGENYGCYYFSWSLVASLLKSLLDEPNPNSPANSQAAQLYQENKREYEKRVSAIVEQSWRDSWPVNSVL